jgi:hypothetical protein
VLEKSVLARISGPTEGGYNGIMEKSHNENFHNLLARNVELMHALRNAYNNSVRTLKEYTSWHS